MSHSIHTRIVVVVGWTWLVWVFGKLVYIAFVFVL